MRFLHRTRSGLMGISTTLAVWAIVEVVSTDKTSLTDGQEFALLFIFVWFFVHTIVSCIIWLTEFSHHLREQLQREENSDERS